MEVRKGSGWGRWTLLALAAGVAWLALALLPSGARAANLTDAGCVQTTDSAFVVNGDRREAQTFTAIHTGGLTRALFQIDNPGVGDQNDFVLQILPTDANGAPVDPPLASATIPSASVPGGTTTLDATFSPPPPVLAGQRYALAVGRPGNFTFFNARAVSGDRCVGGPFFNTGPGWAPENPSNVDFIFQTYVDPAAISFKPGADFTLVIKRSRLFAKVPGPGKLIVDDAKKPKRRSIARQGGFIKHTKAKAKKAGLVKLDVLLTDFAIRRALARRKLNVLGRVTYTPTRGDPSSIVFRIKFHL